MAPQNANNQSIFRNTPSPPLWRSMPSGSFDEPVTSNDIANIADGAATAGGPTACDGGGIEEAMPHACPPSPASMASMRHRTNFQRHHYDDPVAEISRSMSRSMSTSLDDADAAAGSLQQVAAAEPQRRGKLGLGLGSECDFLLLSHSAHAAPPLTEGREEDVCAAGGSIPSSPPSPHVLVLGIDISHLPRSTQFIVCAAGVFGFSLLYGFLQELISVQLCNRKLGLFQATMQFAGYTFWSFLFRSYVRGQQGKGTKVAGTHANGSASLIAGGGSAWLQDVPMELYLGLSILRAVDLGMTNMAMQYVNYPAKTLMKSSRVVFTMLFGVLISRKKYKWRDYGAVMLMVLGLGIFMHADAKSSAVFNLLGVVMLIVSLLCDGAISNMSEAIMNKYDVGQDEFIFKLYSIALVAITAAAAFKGDLAEGIHFLSVPGTLEEIEQGLEPTWSASQKTSVFVMFSTMGFFGSSCSAAITKHFGALTMSLTSTARKATTLFLSFALFNNTCTVEHLGGIVMFISALVIKTLAKARGKGGGGLGSSQNHSKVGGSGTMQIEMGNDPHHYHYHHPNGGSSVHHTKLNAGVPGNVV